MIKAILFDLDGVLISSTKELHFSALNSALSEYSPKYVISPSEQLKTYEGLSTKKKLEFLNLYKGLPKEWNTRIEYRKQELTEKLLAEIRCDRRIRKVICNLRGRGLKVGLCTNSIQKTTNILLEKLHCQDVFDVVLTNEHVQQPKPNPEIYISAIRTLKLRPSEVLILEDSPNGITAAMNSGAEIMIIKSPSDVNLTKVGRFIDAINKLDECMNKCPQFSGLLLQKNSKQTKGHYQSTIVCPGCNTPRTVNNHNIITQIRKGVFTGKCQSCCPSSFQNGTKHVLYNPNKRSTHGYVVLNVSELPEEQKEIAHQISWKNGNRPEYVFEHRLVMSLHLNRPLKKHEIVHHKNGKKDDNRLENLKLLTTKQHHPGHGDDFYQLWQEARAEVEQLKKQICKS